MTYLTSLRDAAVAGEAWADSPVNTEEGTRLCLRRRPGGAGRPHHSDCDWTSGDRCNPGADRPGEYLYECGEGEEQAQVRVYLDEQGAPG